MLLIGSQALIVRGIDTGRKRLDYDLIATFDELGHLTRALRKKTKVRSVPMAVDKTVLHCEDGRIFEVEIAWPDSTAADLLTIGYVWAPLPSVLGLDPLDDTTLAPMIATLDQLYTLKMSHRYKKDSPHFKKTRDDIMLMRKYGAKVFDDAWLKRRETETYTNKLPKLNVMKGDFFRGDGVEYVYDHDTIHMACAHINGKLGDIVPAYTLYMKDDAPVQCDKKKFFDHAERVRLYGVLEEAQVLALERSQIPHRGKVEPRRSFDIALQKVCTSITGGWFREFAWENFDRVNEMYEPDYVDRFWKAVDDGIVRKIESRTH